MTPVPSLVTRQRPVQKMTLLSQARLSLLMPSTETLLPTTQSRQSRATVLLLSTPSLERGHTRQTPTLAAQILLL